MNKNKKLRKIFLIINQITAYGFFITQIIFNILLRNYLFLILSIILLIILISFNVIIYKKII